MAFEDNLKKLETLSQDIKRQDISLEDALKDFEEGIKLAKSLEKELDKIEGKIQILINQGEVPDNIVHAKTEKAPAPELELFSFPDPLTSSSVSQAEGLRQ